MGCECVSRAEEFQPFPARGRLAQQIDCAFPSRGEQGRVFAYVLTTVEVHGGMFIQRGGAPNYQGDMITLCTCMRWHRTWESIKDGVWVAGFCGSTCSGGSQLFYLMRVEQAFPSFAEIWTTLPVTTREAKSASRSVFGDVYEPKGAAATTAGHDPNAYFTPCRGHKHHENEKDCTWHKDISLCHGREAKLLLGEPGKSYLWRSPRYASTLNQGVHPRFRFYDSMSEFYGCLREVA